MALGWTFRGCQLIRDVNKQKKLDFAWEHIPPVSDNFASILFTDKCSVQFESHRRQCCHKVGEPPKSKPWYVN